MEEMKTPTKITDGSPAIGEPKRQSRQRDLRDSGKTGSQPEMDLYRKIETLKIDPQNRIRAQEIARKLWDDTEGGKCLSGKPVKDLRAVLMIRLQAEGVIRKKRK